MTTKSASTRTACRGCASAPPTRAWYARAKGASPRRRRTWTTTLRAAVWLLRSLEYRRRTLSAVAQSLVTRQRAFLDHGPAHLQPLALTEVAAALGLHASTVRRVVTNTYLATAHGVVALASCFQSGPEPSGGETRASLTVKERIKQLVAAEDPAQPLTDQQLVEALAAEHVRIARRTVTQYRRELQLPPAHRRQRISDVQVFCHACGTLRPTHGVPCRACGFVDPTPVVEIGTVAEKDTTLSMGPLAISDEEQRVRQALEAHTRRGLTEPLLGDREEASEVPPEVEEAQRHRYLAWLEQTRKSPKMQEVSRLVERALHTTATVLLTGERGAGKSHMARLLHDQGPRAKGPFITVNCAAIPETFLEAELFGDERGAVTGATQQQPGCLELAAGGTLFLQEIGAMSRVLQAKLPSAGAAREAVRTLGWDGNDHDRRPYRRGHQPRSGTAHRRGTLPPRPVLPPQRLPDRSAAAARAPGGSRAADHVLPHAL